MDLGNRCTDCFSIRVLASSVVGDSSETIRVYVYMLFLKYQIRRAATHVAEESVHQEI